MEFRENNFGKYEYVTLDNMERSGSNKGRIFSLKDDEHIISACYRIVKEIWKNHGSSRSPALTQD